MLENLFTTKMSADKKVLQLRFLKIRSNNGMASRIICIALFIALLIVITISSIITTVNTTDDYTMSEKEFTDYLKKPIGSIMAEFDYIDNNKLVFHSIDGFFVINRQTYDIMHMINLNKLNIAPHQQGSYGLDVKISNNGKYAYLSSYGQSDEIKDFDNYIINLENGNIKIGNIPNGTELFTNYADTLSTVKDIYGWCSDKCISEGDIKTYYLTVQENTTSAIQLVAINHNDSNTAMRYIFGENYVSIAKLHENIIKSSLAEGEEILVNSADGREVDAITAKLIINEISKYMQLKPVLLKDGNYDVKVYQVWKNDSSIPRIFIIDNYNKKLVLSANLNKQAYSVISNILNQPQTSLYDMAVEFLENEFHRVYDSYYDIQSLTISNWQENGNEATFFYKMTYLYYNRDPDKAEYIQEAKKRSQKEYEVLYNDYLALKEANHEFKVVLNGDKLELFSNIAPKGTEWVPIKIDDYVISE